MAKEFKNTVAGAVSIDNIDIKTCKTEITNCNIIEVEVGTNGYQCGDSGHGGRTYFSIKDLASTDMRCRIDDEEVQYIRKIELIFGGDAELQTFYDALSFALNVLGKYTKGSGNYEPTRLEKCKEVFNKYRNGISKFFRKFGKQK